MPRNLRCDQAQAFKSRQFEIFCNDNNIILILAPAGDHRAAGMTERLIQTIKRLLSVLNKDIKWSQITLADKVSEIIQEKKFIPNTATKIAPYTAHFDRKINTPFLSITTKTSSHNLSNWEIKFFLDKKRGLKQPMLNAESIWNIETDSEPELDIWFNNEHPDEGSASDNSTLQNDTKKATKHKKSSPIKITPDKLMMTFGDKTTTIITNTKKQVARKTHARRTTETRGTHLNHSGI